VTHFVYFLPFIQIVTQNSQQLIICWQYETEIEVSVSVAAEAGRACVGWDYSESIHTQSFHEDFCPTCFEGDLF